MKLHYIIEKIFSFYKNSCIIIVDGHERIKKMKQTVKNYSFYPGDFRNNVKSLDIVTQINHDLKKNPSWSIKLMTYLMEDSVCTVVFDVEESSRVLNESVKTRTFEQKEEVTYLEDADASSEKVN